MREARGIVRRRKVYWFNRQVRGLRVWMNLHTENPAEAIIRAAQFRNNPLVNGSGFISDIERFLTWKSSHGEYTRQSVSSRRNVLELFKSWLPPDCLTENITPKQVDNWFHYLLHKKNPVTLSTAAGYLATASAFFRWSIEQRLRGDNPVDTINVPKIGKTSRIRWVKRTDKIHLINDAPTDSLRFILYCGFDAGLRRGEIVEARRDWFDLDAGCLTVRRCDRPPRLRDGELPFAPKDRDERTIPLTKSFSEFLHKFLTPLTPTDFTLEPTVTHGTWRYRYDFRRPFTDYMNTQKLPWVTPHVMRHSFASILASAGVSIFKIAQWLGDDVRVVQRHYAHLAPGDTDIDAL